MSNCTASTGNEEYCTCTSSSECSSGYCSSGYQCLSPCSAYLAFGQYTDGCYCEEAEECLSGTCTGNVCVSSCDGNQTPYDSGCTCSSNDECAGGLC
mmetsp:Transcript_21745/g.16080  ORF Transcript_21745/g.16080 Transcript_21745/m.16080 type:complete len:97 (-) Transcript_21745:5192-5482(-)